MDANLLYHALKEATTVVEWNRNGKGIGIRCPYCGDSIKDPTHWHMNIKTDSDIFVYRCVRCGVSGKVTPKFLKDINCYDLTILRQASENKRKTFSRGRRTVHRNTVNIPVTTNPKYTFKIDYLNWRLDANFTPVSARDYNIILSLRDLALVNKNVAITYTKDKHRFYNDLDDNWIGFMTSDGANISFRNISSNMNLRYHELCLDPSKQGESCYVIQHNNISLTKPDLLIGIAEGGIDALGVWAYHALNGIYIDAVVSPLSKNYTTSIHHVWFMTGRLDAKFILFADSEIKKHEYEDLAKFLPDLKIYKNQLADDFGHPASRISPMEYTIKSNV